MQPSKLDLANAAMVKGMLIRGDRAAAIAAFFNIHINRVHDIRAGRSYADVRPRGQRRLPKLTDLPITWYRPGYLSASREAPIKTDVVLSEGGQQALVLLTEALVDVGACMRVAVDGLRVIAESLSFAANRVTMTAKVLRESLSSQQPEETNDRVDTSSGKTVPAGRVTARRAVGRRTNGRGATH